MHCLIHTNPTGKQPVGDQLDAQFFYIIRLFQSPTCFDQAVAHHQEVSCINTAYGIVTICKWPSGMQVEQEQVSARPAYRTATYSDWLYQILY